MCLCEGGWESECGWCEGSSVYIVVWVCCRMCVCMCACVHVCVGKGARMCMCTCACVRVCVCVCVCGARKDESRMRQIFRSGHLESCYLENFNDPSGFYSCLNWII